MALLVVEAPTLDNSLFEGTMESVYENVGSAMNTLIDTIIAPAEAAINLVKGMMDTADATYQTANAAYQTAVLLTPGTAAQLKQSMERAQDFQQRLANIYDKLDTAMETVQYYKDDIKETLSGKLETSKERVAEKMNKCLQAINEQVQKVVDWVNKKLEKIQKALEKKIDEAKQKAEKKTQEAAQMKLEEFMKQQKNNQLAQSRRQLKLSSMIC